MTLRRQISLVRLSVLVLFFVLVAIAIVVAGELQFPVVYFTPAIALVVWMVYTRAPNRLAGRAFASLSRKLVAGETKAARAMLNELREVYHGSRHAMEQLRLQESMILSLERRHAEAAALIASLDRKVLPKHFIPVLLNNLAWSVALSGEPGRGVDLARESMEASEHVGHVASSQDVRASQLGTLGAALTLAGKPEEGAPLLEQALARGGSKYSQSARAFYLGEALRALGRADDATAAYERAMREGEDNAYANDAREKLAAQKTYRT
jgi:tetratricopeptide (TPR) repeat protein